MLYIFKNLYSLIFECVFVLSKIAESENKTENVTGYIITRKIFVKDKFIHK